MGERTQYTPGTFSWTDLSTTDVDAAKAFYGGLFGWQPDDFPVGDGEVYSMQEVDGKDVAAISRQPQQQRDAGVPPMWNSYVTVESADAAAERAAELGATVHAGPFDVFDSGRMAVVQDPQGAFFMVWQPKENIGAQLVNEPGALCWNELRTTDLDAAQSFYGALFGWQFEQFEQSPEPYLIIQNQGKGNGGIGTLPEGSSAPYWLVYFACSDLDAAMSKADELGGQKVMGPMDIGVARIAVMQDPQGAIFVLYDGELQP